MIQNVMIVMGRRVSNNVDLSSDFVPLSLFFYFPPSTLNAVRIAPYPTLSEVSKRKDSWRFALSKIFNPKITYG